MLKIPNLKEEAPHVDSPFTFPLDPFQKYAIAAIANDENVLVTAKTGSGKTLVGEYQIWHSLNKGKRVFYTTPIKSLSNQKFHDLKKVYGDRVGIMTGDIKFAPQSDIVIMTTEILRNLLFKQGTTTEHVGVTSGLSVQNLDAVVFDEVHYVNDPDRGKVWEECLTLLSSDVKLVLLSATIDQPEVFAKWLGDIKQRPIHLLSTEYRVVPLVHMTESGDVIMDAKDKFYEDVYSVWYRKQLAIDDEVRKHKDRVRAREKGQDVVEKTAHKYSFVERLNRMIERCDLPALFFVFSRQKCRAYAESVTHNLITSSDAAAVHHIIKFHLRNVPNIEKMEQYHSLVKLLEKGIAYHHSGLLPVLKEIIEILFDKGFIKVLFATETFAVGINMPTKTVVFTSFRKFDNEKMRMLTTSEYIQMAGRAGRRGKDDRGFVYYLPAYEPEHPSEIATMMTGKKAHIESKMDFGYSYILSCIQSGKEIQSQTFWASQRIQEIADLKKDIGDLKMKVPPMDEIIVRDCAERERIEYALKVSVNAEKKKNQADLNRWSNSHAGPKWSDGWKQYKIRSSMVQRIDMLENDLESMLDMGHSIHLRKMFLTDAGYISDGLTHKGVLASEIHEGHPLLMSHMFDEKMIHSDTSDMIACVLSMFLDTPNESEYPETSISTVSSVVSKVAKYAGMLSGIERIKSEESYWDTTVYWADPVHDWMNGDDFVCEKYGIEQGNFVKAMLKLSNIIEEWNTMAVISQDVDMIEKLKDTKQKIVRSFVIPDSLYLRI